MYVLTFFSFFFFFNDTATTEIYTLSLHDALPILGRFIQLESVVEVALRGNRVVLISSHHTEILKRITEHRRLGAVDLDRKSTRLNSSHDQISYAVFCLKKKKIRNMSTLTYNTITN